jgi:hypothetical protein
VLCPRCDYDLAGQVGNWHPHGASTEGAACPLHATCSECGLVFEWSLVMRPSLATPRWLVEARPMAGDSFGWFGLRALWGVAWRAWATQARLLRPGRFWRRVGLQAPVRPTRLAMWIALCPIGLIALLTLVFSLVALPDYLPGGVWSVHGALQGAKRVLIAHRTGIMEDLNSANRLLSPWHKPVWISSLLACVLMASLMLLVLPDTRRVARVRARHVLRVLVYGLGWGVIALVLGAGQGAMAANLAGAQFDLGALGEYWFDRGWPNQSLLIVDRQSWWGSATGVLIDFAFVTPCISLAWWLAYWWFALSRGLRLRNARQVYWSSVVAGVLLGLLVGATWVLTR